MTYIFCMNICIVLCRNKTSPPREILVRYNCLAFISLRLQEILDASPMNSLAAGLSGWLIGNLPTGARCGIK